MNDNEDALRKPQINNQLQQSGKGSNELQADPTLIKLAARHPEILQPKVWMHKCMCIHIHNVSEIFDCERGKSGIARCKVLSLDPNAGAHSPLLLSRTCQTVLRVLFTPNCLTTTSYNPKRNKKQRGKDANHYIAAGLNGCHHDRGCAHQWRWQR